MKTYPPPAAPTPRIPPFHPVPLRCRDDGWTPIRQAEFIGWLAQTRSVSAAARAVGMSRETAYRLRRHPGAAGFAAAWDIALRRPRNPASRKVTAPDLDQRAESGLVRPVLRYGAFMGVVRKPDISALLGLIARLERLDRQIARCPRPG